MKIAFIISCIVIAILAVIVIVQHYSIKKLSGTTTTTTATTTTSGPAADMANQKGSIPFGELVKSTQDTYKGFEMKVNVTPTS